MTTIAIARNYDKLSPEERFRLILAASGRGDEAERDRLLRTGKRISLSMPDHSCHAHAFDELATLIFVELLEETAKYHDAMDAFDLDAGDEAIEYDDEPKDSDKSPEADTRELMEEHGRPPWARWLAIAYAQGYVLRSKVEGWKLFCERLNVPPFYLWEGLPGFDRLQRTLSVVEEAAFTSEDFLRGSIPSGQLERRR